MLDTKLNEDDLSKGKNKSDDINFGLPSDQEHDLYEIFCDIVDTHDYDTEDCIEYFKQGTESFTNFLLLLEYKTNWFDYTQVDELIFDLECYIDILRDDDSEDYDD